MVRDDWIGLGASVGGHGALLLLLALLVPGRPEAPAPSALQLEVGAFAQGQPIARATPAEATPAEEDSEVLAAEEEAAAAPAEENEAPAPPAEDRSTPVDLPEQEAQAGSDPPPEPDPPPEEQPEPSAPPAADAAQADTASARTPVADASAEAAREEGAETGSAQGATRGEEGISNDAERAAPFDIEGLDRTRLHGGLPSYTEKVNATIKVEITVGPQGRVVGQRLLQKANPSLERSVMEALRRWRFDRLPAGAPQTNQTGVVTFRFRLE